MEPQVTGFNLPWPIPLAPGRFYGCGQKPNENLIATSSIGYMFLNPTTLPHSAVLTALGIEVTSTGTGASCILGVYDQMLRWDKLRRRFEYVPIPGNLICETASIDLSASTGYKNAAVTYRNGYNKLPQGLVFLAWSHNTSSTNAAVRCQLNNSEWPTWLGGGMTTLSATDAINARYLRWGAIRVYAWSHTYTGFPRKYQFASMGGNNTYIQEETYLPRVMMEF